jgi:biopolymer transport protein ExbB
MLESVWNNLVFYFESGGYVMGPLVLSSLLIWFGIGYRWSVLHRPDARNVRRLLQKHQEGTHKPEGGLVEQAVVKALNAARRDPVDLRRVLDDVLAEDEQVLQRFSRMTKALVAAAPILGLLGTVNGMISTFEALGEMKLFAQSGGIAGGISQALFTTQLGLAVAIPGLVVHGVLERRARERGMELTQLKDMLCARAEEIRTDNGGSQQ